MNMHQTIVPAGILVVLLASCGPGALGNDGDSMPLAPEWVYGWWMDGGGLQDHSEWGANIAQLEIQPDGTFIQTTDYCQREAWTYEGRWALQPGGAVRLLPHEGDEVMPFQYPSQEYRYVDLRPGGGSCDLSAVRVSAIDGNEFPAVSLERGRWCIGGYLPAFDECEMEKYCGDPPPICE